jgi:hypothetical protein
VRGRSFENLYFRQVRFALSIWSRLEGASEALAPSPIGICGLNSKIAGAALVEHLVFGTVLGLLGVRSTAPVQVPRTS